MRDIWQIMKGSGRLVLDTLLPNSCLTCQTLVAEPFSLCGACWGELMPITAPVCAVLGLPMPFDIGEDAVCALALKDPPPFGRARAAVVYNDKARALVTGLKFADALPHAPFMARMMVASGGQLLEDCDVVVPVPLHWRRQIRRQYNQAGLLAKHIGRLSGVRVDHQLVKRKRLTQQQTGLDKASRQQNVLNAFDVSKPFKVHNKHIVIIDDVYTTGATVREVSKTLIKAGARQVDVISFARVVMDETGFVSPELARLDDAQRFEASLE